MPDNVRDVGVSAESDPQTSSPSPSPETNGCVEQILSRKREREVSLEPATPKTSLVANASDIKSPAKKGRVHLDSTLEEEDVQQRSRSRTPSHPHSPALSVSPPHEVKVRQISQGVEDINWQRQGSLLQNDVEHLDEVFHDKEDEQAAIQAEVGQVVEEPPCSLPPTQAVTEADEAGDVPSNLSSARRTSESEGVEPEKGLKRKLADRGTSQGPESGPSSPSVATSSTETVKRPRDGGDEGDNPHLPKRPSPPPEQQAKPPVASDPSTPKLGGFMAYASAASPFASVKGQNVFSGASSSPPLRKPPTSPIPQPTPPPSSSAANQSPFAQSTPSTHFQHTSLQQTPQSTATKRSGFEAFAGSTSPFASPFPHTRPKSPLGSSSKAALVRSKSPPRRTNLCLNAGGFSSYASGGTQAFAVPHPKRARADSPSGGSSRSSLEHREVLGSTAPGSNESSASGEEEEGERDEHETAPSTFGEKLRSAKDVDEDYSEDEKEKLTEQEVLTGEEEEETIHQVRGKLYVLCPQNQWKERGTGQLKLNVRRSDGGGARLVMRKEAVFTVILNVTLFHGMKCFLAQDPRYIRFSAIEGANTIHYNLRVRISGLMHSRNLLRLFNQVANSKIAKDLFDEINANIPF
ncbi:hypothetical protein ID866_2629 [Astraeus odoratus]|nr:hypothetical protein ID866_2629 [Astraeus odoratus]